MNKANDESVLLDLKHLLIEAKQKVPLFLTNLQSEQEKYLDLGGKSYECEGLSKVGRCQDTSLSTLSGFKSRSIRYKF